MCILFRFVVLFVIHSLISSEKVCHDYGFIPRPDHCVSTCSITNDQCREGKKCCYRLEEPCGFHCVFAKEDTKKDGQCPTGKISNMQWYLCDASFCDVDNDCPAKEKCCSNTCGAKVCITAQ